MSEYEELLGQMSRAYAVVYGVSTRLDMLPMTEELDHAQIAIAEAVARIEDAQGWIRNYHMPEAA
jgi:hypothetical protein